jgi:hypothetical protein
MNMVSRNSSRKGPVLNAAQRALETGDANYILIWIPEESENTLKNLLEKTCCYRNTRNPAQNPDASWYFSTMNRLHVRYCGPHHLELSTKTTEEKKIIFLVERACESGGFEEIPAVIRDTSGGEMRQRFNDVMQKKKYDPGNIAAGRAYVSAFTGFIAWLNTLSSGSRGDLRG